MIDRSHSQLYFCLRPTSIGAASGARAHGGQTFEVIPEGQLPWQGGKREQEATFGGRVDMQSSGYVTCGDKGIKPGKQILLFSLLASAE
jgi:hypothetical protein